MKTKKKALLMTLSAVLLVTVSVFGTMAYLTDNDTVTNTFTVGDVKLTLDEADVKTDGTYEMIGVVEGGSYTETYAPRVQENEYHLIPGHTYIKDPTVHIDPTSEDCWVFIKVENGISQYEAAESTTDPKYTPIAKQITAKGWTALSDVNNVYYKTYTKNGTKDFVVFENFKISGTANEVEDWDEITNTSETAKIVVTAYAVQKDGFNTAKAAWDETFGKSAS